MDVERHIGDVTGTIRQALERTTLKPLVAQFAGALYGGKMLRSRLALRVGAAAGVPMPTLIGSAAATEMLHAASLLHDDVIDGARVRRGAPAFWVSRGTSGSVLLGDLMVCAALSLIVETDGGVLVPEFVRRAKEMCEAEAEQELMPPEEADWAASVSLARRKTGSLFAFVGYASGGASPELRAALRESGYLAGTAYQLADDLFDSYGDPLSSDKTLGLDATHPRVTAVTGWQNHRGGSPDDPVAYIQALCERSEQALAGWPVVRAAWHEFLSEDLQPSIHKFVELFVPAV